MPPSKCHEPNWKSAFLQPIDLGSALDTRRNDCRSRKLELIHRFCGLPPCTPGSSTLALPWYPPAHDSTVTRSWGSYATVVCLVCECELLYYGVITFFSCWSGCILGRSLTRDSVFISNYALSLLRQKRLCKIFDFSFFTKC